MHAVRDLLSRTKNPQTKLVLFHYLRKRNALDPSVGLILNRNRWEVVHIY